MTITGRRSPRPTRTVRGTARRRATPTVRGSARHRSTGVTRLAVAAVLAAVMSAGIVPGVSRAPFAPAPAPAGAATTTVRPLRTVDVPLNTLSVAPGTPEYFSSPALADLNGDDRPELVVAAPNGTVTATRLTDGARLWQRSLGPTAIQASPVVSDVDRDGSVDVVVATMDGRVVLLDGQSGGVKRTFRQGPPQFCPAGVDCRPDGFFATPVIGDVNGDGHLDIIAASYDHSLYAWSVGGTLLWRSFLHDTLWSSPALVDIDKDGRLEVVLGGDIYAGNPLGVPAGGLLWALRGTNGTRFPGYPRSIPGQTVWSSPAIADVDGDTRMDVIVGTGTHGPFGDGTVQRRVHAFTLADRRDLPGWPAVAPGRVVHQPAVGDIDGDGRPEVVVASEGGYLTAFDHTGVSGGVKWKWATCNAAAVTQCPGSSPMPTHGGVVIADVDGDGQQEVVSALSQRMRVYNGANRAIEADVRLTGGNGSLGPSSIAAISEINGSTVIAQSYLNRAGGHGGPAVAGDAVRTDLLTTDRPLCAEDWPGFKRGPMRTSWSTPRPTWHPFDCGRPFVAQQYSDLLGRSLDAAGQSFWTARLRTTWSGARVVRGFMNSGEFGVVAAPVVRLHLGLKGGPPMPSAEVRSQMRALRSGTSLARVAEGLLDDPPWVSESDAALVDRVYRNGLGRSPTAPERAAALSSISGRGRPAWLADISGSPAVVAHLEGPVQVAMTYIGLLDRGPDASGWTFWVGRVRSGTPPQRLIELFLATSEYRRRVL